MNYGFIYCLGNQAMPGIFKIGMTERAPAQRCQELSGSTAAAMPFDVLCFGQVEDPRNVEAELHGIFESCRVNRSREFFETDYSRIYDVICSYSSAVAVTSDGEEEAHREALRLDFLAAEDSHHKIEALIKAARFAGIRFWRDGDALKNSGYLSVSSWISGAVHVMRPQLLAHVPAEKPVLRLLSAQVIAEEIGL